MLGCAVGYQDEQSGLIELFLHPYLGPNMESQILFEGPARKRLKRPSYGGHKTSSMGGSRDTRVNDGAFNDTADCLWDEHTVVTGASTIMVHTYTSPKGHEMVTPFEAPVHTMVPTWTLCAVVSK